MLQTQQPNGSLLCRLWGKTNERDKGYTPDQWKSHPAICHMLDVAFVAQVWLEANPFILKRFCDLAPGIAPDQLKSIILTITALHDLGKIHAWFQAKSPKGWEAGYNTRISKPTENSYKGFDHGLGSARIMRQLRSVFPQWESWWPAIRAAAAHHGSFHDVGRILGSAPECPLVSSVEASVAAEAVHLVCDIFQAPQTLPVLPPSKGFLMFLTGFISVSDWFGSNSTLFPFASLSSEQDVREYYSSLDSARVKNALQAAGLLPQYNYRQQDFVDLFDFMKSDADLRPLQAKAREIQFGNQAGAEMIILEAPMGMGKTEIALYLTSRAMTAQTADGLYFALPTQASSNSMMKRVFSFSEKIKQEQSSISVMLAHSGRTYDKKFAKLIVRASDRGNREYNKENTPSEVIAPDWLLSSKRVLLAAVGVGTIDQAMLGAISVRHAFVRLFALAGKVVVFDEIHAYDAYMNTIILHLLQWLHLLETKVILLSATLPGSLRRELLGTYCKALPTEEASEQTTNDAYPQILHVQKGVLLEPFTLPDNTPSPGEYIKPPVRVRALEYSNAERTTHGVAKALELAQKGGNVVWIRNTVKEAQEAYTLLAGQCSQTGTDVEILHAQYIRADRNKKEDVLLAQLGKDGGDARPKRFILISTQVIEQSVDIDFDAMISDLAPIDLLLQRIGRLWRHERTGQRYEHQEPELYVLIPTAEERRDLNLGSSAYVYDADTLARTATLIPTENFSTWIMPDACRDLVSTVYDHDELWWSAERLSVEPQALNKVRSRHTNRTDKMESGAKQITLRGATEREDEIAMAPVLCSDDEKGERMALTTRYGMNSTTVVLLRTFGEHLAFAGKPEISLAAIPEDESATQRMDVEEAVALSSVAFPWYEKDKLRQPKVPEAAAMIKWWQERHPYDTRIFLPIDETGTITHERFIANYTYNPDGRAAEGMVIMERFPRPEKAVVSATDIA